MKSHEHNGTLQRGCRLDHSIRLLLTDGRPGGDPRGRVGVSGSVRGLVTMRVGLVNSNPLEGHTIHKDSPEDCTCL
jgi:hypothetical protein